MTSYSQRVSFYVHEKDQTILLVALFVANLVCPSLFAPASPVRKDLTRSYLCKRPSKNNQRNQYEVNHHFLHFFYITTVITIAILELIITIKDIVKQFLTFGELSMRLFEYFPQMRKPPFWEPLVMFFNKNMEYWAGLTGIFMTKVLRFRKTPPMLKKIPK